MWSVCSIVVLEESPCPRGSSRTNLQVLVLVLVRRPQVLVLVLGPQVVVLVLVLRPQVLVLVLGSQVLVLVLVLRLQVLVLVLVLGPQVLVLILVLRPQVLVLGPQSSQKLSRTLYSANSPLCMFTWSINSVTATMHEVMVNSGLLTHITYYLLI